MDAEARVHVAAEPRPTHENDRRIVQPCARCGLVLAEFDLDNPPNVMCVPGETPKPLAWFGIGDQYERDPGYPDGGMTMTCLVTDGVIARDGTPLCDPDEVPSGTETFRTAVHGDE
jgi:hypothetical protein